jgi:hypothetical protein
MSELTILPFPATPPNFEIPIIVLPSKNYKKYVIGIVGFGIVAIVVMMYSAKNNVNEK